MNIIRKKRRQDVHKKTERRRLPVGVYALYLFVCTLMIQGVTLARYTASAFGQSQGSVARFDVELASGDRQNDQTIQFAENGQTALYSLELRNNSEVTVLPTHLALTLISVRDPGGAFDSGVTITFQKGEQVLAVLERSGGNGYTYEGTVNPDTDKSAYHMMPGETGDYQIVFTVTGRDNLKNSDYSFQINEVRCDVEQED